MKAATSNRAREWIDKYSARTAPLLTIDLLRIQTLSSAPLSAAFKLAPLCSSFLLASLNLKSLPGPRWEEDGTANVSQESVRPPFQKLGCVGLGKRWFGVGTRRETLPQVEFREGLSSEFIR